ncbi:hypothetical protein [Peptoniphilus stercorisuis]|uniref:Uncharacterized protein n=1 Tax=Peptoniphilus stercorisuis TaxID=1436965 RepID=A0ABS4KDE4_9FIRM|nr:hypothetical protein [Peptoniphilus stercorisuis]MBP2025780.1 hypothetical protein [Peptoniphilus stercorisuis]
MLYRLSLTSLDSFKEVVEEEKITINYRPYSNYIDISSDRESLTARNQRDILNITALVNSINRIEDSDLIWIKYEDNYVLARIKGKVSLNQNNAILELPCEIYISKNTPKVIKDIFDDIKFARVFDDIIYKITMKILNILKKREEKTCEMEFVKGRGELLEVEETTSNIIPYVKKSSEIANNSVIFSRINKENSNNSGEIVIKVDSNEDMKNLPVKVQSKEIEQTKDFYVDIMEKQVDFYMDLQRKTMENFLELQEDLWSKFFDMIK